jgi:hypothetical protein
MKVKKNRKSNSVKVINQGIKTNGIGFYSTAKKLNLKSEI